MRKCKTCGKEISITEDGFLMIPFNLLNKWYCSDYCFFNKNKEKK